MYIFVCMLKTGRMFWFQFRNLPRAILIAIPLVTFCYLMVNISFLTVLSPEAIAASSSVANV